MFGRSLELVCTSPGAIAITCVLLVGMSACEDLPFEAGTSEVAVRSTTSSASPLAAKGGNPGKPGDDLVSLALTLGPGSLIDDGNAPYINDKCGVESSWQRDPSFFDFRPLRWLNKKQEREIAADPDCDGVFPREARVNLHDAIVRSYCVAPAAADQCQAGEEVVPAAGTTVADLASEGRVDAPNSGGDPMSTFAVRLFNGGRDGDPSTAPGGLNTEYCLDDGTGRPLRFDPERNPGSHELLVTTASDGRPTRIESQLSPNNVGSCAHTRADGTLVVLNVELDVAIDLEEVGS